MKKPKQYDDAFINQLCSLLDRYDSLKHLECDGLTQVLHRVLSDKNIQHTVNMGEVIHKPTNSKIPVHYWIEIEDLRIDYRLRMWLGETLDVPHGVFCIDSEKSVSYQGLPLDLPLLPLPVIGLLIGPLNSIFLNR